MVRATLPEQALFNAITDGIVYLVNEFVTVPVDGSTNIHIDNDSSTGVWLFDMVVVVDGGTKIRLYDRFDFITPGTDVTMQNALMDSSGGLPDEGEFSVYSESTFTPTNGSIPVGLTASGGSPRTDTVPIFPSKMEPGREVVLEINDTESTQKEALVAMLLVESHD